MYTDYQYEEEPEEDTENARFMSDIQKNILRLIKLGGPIYFKYIREGNEMKYKFI
jgi:hypothetical protein